MSEDERITPVPYRPLAERESPGRGPKWDWRIAILGLPGFVLLVLLWFSLTAVSVRVVSTPPADDVDLPRTLLKLRLGEQLLVRPGTHKLVLQKPGYFDLEAEIEVTGADDQEVAFTLTKRPGLLALTTRPDLEAAVAIDGAEVARTPFEPVEVAPGPHTLSVNAPRYVEWVSEIEIEGGDVLQTYEAELTPAWSPITFTSEPAGAAVRSGEHPLGTTPLTADLDAGDHALTFELEGFKTVRVDLIVEPNSPLEHPRIEFVPADGLLFLTSAPAGAQVSLGEELAGRTPLELELPSGERHSLTLFKTGYEVAVRELVLETGERREIDVALAPRYGTVELDIRPPGAEVVVGGRRVDASAGSLRLIALPHRIEIRKDGYAPHVIQVTPRPGPPKRFEVRLLTLEEDARMKTKREIVAGRGHVLKLVEPGSFVMGSPKGEAGRRPNENPVSVELTRRFYIGLNEVTNQQFRDFRPEHRSRAYRGKALDGDTQPVTSVSWNDAARYCNWLSAQEGLSPAYVERDGKLSPARPLPASYRLPTEAEWTWVARFSAGGTPARYPWGDALPPPPGSGNYADASAQGVVPESMDGYNDGFAVTAPVASARPNALGVFDLGGNVAEWVQDFYSIYPRGSSTVLTNPLGPKDGAHRVIRGSSFVHWSTTQLRFAYRDYGSTGRPDVGFRIARYAN